MKAHAGDLKTRADLVGISGQSSGGHLAMLAAMRPRRRALYRDRAAGRSPSVDASVRCVAMSWPVINPLSRYSHALRARRRRRGMGRPTSSSITSISGAAKPPWPKAARCWLLERGEKARLPPALWIQAPNDTMHDYHDPDGTFPGNEPARFVADYRKAGGTIDLVYFDAPLRFTSVQPTAQVSLDAFAKLVAFFHGHMPAER